MNEYHRKLYALLHDSETHNPPEALFEQLQCLKGHLSELQKWWKTQGRQLQDIGSSSDCVNLNPNPSNPSNQLQVHHPISGQSQSISPSLPSLATQLSQITQEPDVKKVFWWFWRFYPEILASQHSDALLVPAHEILPDCPRHSYNSTVSALTGAIPSDWQPGQPNKHPYLFLFTFSPVQEFIKASRKFLDFWAGSYLLHYFSAKLCWQIAQDYGPDAVITPSLWSQEIIDALIVKQYPDFAPEFAHLSDKTDPVSRFQDKQSTSLSTAGFPNVITALVPGKQAAEALGKKLGEHLTGEWKAIADWVRQDIKTQVIDFLKDQKKQDNRNQILAEFLSADREACQRDLEKWQQGGCWEWNKLWDVQIENTWESYWTAVPLGNPDQELEIQENSSGQFDSTWKADQEAIAPSHPNQSTPTPAEETAYTTLNVGTWWGNGQSRLGKLIQSVKNTRTWRLPTAPGERSTLSGQYSAVHPQLHYKGKLREGAGVSAGSMRLFWRVMAETYPGLFNGSEKLNALEITKRMAWYHGKVAETLGIKLKTEEGEVDYEGLIRFPNLSSIAAAGFAKEHPERVQLYWDTLKYSIKKATDESGQKLFTDQQIQYFISKTRRPFQVPKTDAAIKQKLSDSDNGYNGVMFSSKWLADDMGLNQSQGENSRQTLQINKLRELVEATHKDKKIGFGDGSPADWWVIVLADGDGMGKYVSGVKLKDYQHYIVESALASCPIQGWNDLLKTRKRMGPATHVGLNRALLDFSNRLVPYLTEKRFCGKVVYSGGDDVMAVLPLEELPEFLLCLRAAWCGAPDPGAVHRCGLQPGEEFESRNSGYWHPRKKLEGLPQRPLFTMGEGATMSMGIVIAYKSVPLPTVLENLWSAEKERAKKLSGTCKSDTTPPIPAKDGLCFRVIYGGGNTLEALMKGHLLESWWKFIQQYQQTELSSVLYRLAEELPRRACLTQCAHLLSKAAEVVLNRRDQTLPEDIKKDLCHWLDEWERWAFYAQKVAGENALGTQPQDLAMLLRFSAFWVKNSSLKYR